MWQPRAIVVLVVIGVLLQNGPYFLALSCVLWWNVFLPALNPFDAVYNRFFASRRDLPRLQSAPPPRRGAQAIAGAFMLSIGLSLLFQWNLAAWILEGFLLIALAALIFGKFCLGSYLFLWATGRSDLAHQTLPWKSGK